MTSFEVVAEAFSRKALVYDSFGEDHPNLARMRHEVYRHLLDHVQPPARILELNAGTGTDAAFLAQMGFRVHATDIAPGMLAQIQAKIQRSGLEDRLSVEQRSFTDLESLEGGPFDAILSNMGGLNCVPDLRPVARQIARVLSPGGSVIWVIMPPLCLWELGAFARGDWRVATRRLKRGGVLANVEGVPVMTYYHTPEQVAASFDARFRIERVRGLSVFAPPADHKQFAFRFPRLYHWLVALDKRLADRRPFRAWGDMFMITLCFAGPQDGA